MKILSTQQIRELDKYTIEHEPVSSIDLMERAAGKFTEAVSNEIQPTDLIYVFCGMGNNGGDGLAVARMLIESGCKSVTTYVVKHSDKGGADFLVNEERLKRLTAVNYISCDSEIHSISKTSVIIDAIFGSGLSRAVEGIAAKVIQSINQSGARVYSVDVPSGLYCDAINAAEDIIIQSTCTYTFHAPKLTFLLVGNAKYVSDFIVLNIGLSNDYDYNIEVTNEYIDDAVISSFFHKRDKFSHKGTYGHILIAAGGYGKMGAAVLSVGAALKSGAGLVTTHIAKCGYNILQTAHPEAMVLIDKDENEITGPDSPTDYSGFSVIGIGPGMGKADKTADFLEALMKEYHKPMIIDADALNIISDLHYLRDHIPEGSILTPHPGEFKRLMGTWSDDLGKIQKQVEFSKQHQVVVVLKGANTSISTPTGKVYFNSTGNPGMAKGGSGDVLTGVITALLAQGYSSEQAAILGVFIHGKAGDIAAHVLGQTGMTAQDIIAFLPEAFAEFE